MKPEVPLCGYGEEGSGTVHVLMMDRVLLPFLQASSAIEGGQKSQLALLSQVTYECIFKISVQFSGCNCFCQMWTKVNKSITNKYITFRNCSCFPNKKKWSLKFSL